MLDKPITYNRNVRGTNISWAEIPQKEKCSFNCLAISIIYETTSEDLNELHLKPSDQADWNPQLVLNVQSTCSGYWVRMYPSVLHLEQFVQDFIFKELQERYCILPTSSFNWILYLWSFKLQAAGTSTPTTQLINLLKWIILCSGNLLKIVLKLSYLFLNWNIPY